MKRKEIVLPLELMDCTSCKVISTAAFFTSSAYLIYGANYWTDRRVNKRFLYPFSASNEKYLFLGLLVTLSLLL